MKLLLVEMKLHLREWPFLIFTIGLPVALLVVLGLSIPDMTRRAASGERAVDTQMPSMMTLLALLVLACNVVPAVLTAYREQGVLRRMSTTPVHPGRLLGVQLLRLFKMQLNPSGGFRVNGFVTFPPGRATLK